MEKSKNGNKQTYQLTQKGIDKLKEELDFLKNTERDRNLEALKEARAQGDLSENADYEAARDEQARIEGRIKEIENILTSNIKQSILIGIGIALFYFFSY